MIRNIKKFLKISVSEKLLFIEALALHMWVGLFLKAVSFKRLVRHFSSRRFETPTKEEDQSRTRSVGTEVGSQQSELLQAVKDAVRRAGRVSPWKNRCLVSSLAARVMLNRRGIRSDLTLGVAKEDNGNLIAHSWLKADGYEIVEMGGNYTGLYNF